MYSTLHQCPYQHSQLTPTLSTLLYLCMTSHTVMVMHYSAFDVQSFTEHMQISQVYILPKMNKMTNAISPAALHDYPVQHFHRFHGLNQ